MKGTEMKEMFSSYADSLVKAKVQDNPYETPWGERKSVRGVSIPVYSFQQENWNGKFVLPELFSFPVLSWQLIEIGDMV